MVARGTGVTNVRLISNKGPISTSFIGFYLLPPYKMRAHCTKYNTE